MIDKESRKDAEAKLITLEKTIKDKKRWDKSRSRSGSPL